MQAIKPLLAHDMLKPMAAELHAYVTACATRAQVFDQNDIEKYTEDILSWWHTNGPSFPAWAKAAKMTFAISPNSASCERVFALLKNMFGDDQESALADYLQSAMMLRHNKRTVG